MNVISEISLVLLLMDLFVGRTETEKQYLPLPTNITLRIEGPTKLSWDLRWTWEPPVVNCTLIYPVIIWEGADNKLTRCSSDTFVKFPLHRFQDLNNVFFDFKACCGNGCRYMNAGSNSICNGTESKGIFLHTPLATGEANTSVRNLSCVWYYQEYVECSWQPANVIPGNVNYSLLYWETSENLSSIRPTELKDLLDTGKHCHTYITNEQSMTIGCQFQLRNSIEDSTGLLMVVTDRSKNIKPLSQFKDACSIAKLRPPTIHEVSRIPNQHCYVRWSMVHVDEGLKYEVAYKMSANGKEDYKITENLNIEIPNVLPKDTFTVKVRAKPRCGGFWSEWSKEEVVTGIDHSRTILTVTLVVIPIVIVITVIILSIYIKRIKTMIFPQIPDPGKMFQDDFQEWLKNDNLNHFKTPQKEQVCPVSVLEMPLKSDGVD